MKRNALPTYFFLAYLITWMGVLPLVLSGLDILKTPVSPLLHGIGAFGPLAAALLVTAATSGRPGLKEFAGRIFRWQVGAGWIVIALFSPILIFLVAAVLLWASGAPWPLFSPLAQAFSDPKWVLLLIASSLLYGFGEEPGWRGFALPRLQNGRSALQATFLLSILWALWHVPFFFYRFEFQGFMTIFGFFLSLFAGALWLTFLYNSTGGSILMVALWHTVWNVMNVSAQVLSGDLVMVANLIMLVVGVGVLWIGRPARLSLHKKQILAL